MELFRIPAELALDEQVHGAGVVPVVLQDKFLPWKREEILRKLPEPSGTVTL